MEEIKIGGRSNGKSLENAITFMKYLEELETNKLYGIKKCGNITLLTKTECIPISFIEKKIEEMEKIKQKDEVDEFGIHSRDWWVADIIQEQFKELLDERNNADV